MRFEGYLTECGIIAAQQARRMKHVELMSELVYAASIESVGNKKRVLDTAMQQDALKGLRLRKAESATTTALNRLRKMFPDLGPSTRFRRITDFYSIAVLIQDFERSGLILDDRILNRRAWDLLVAFGIGVDDLSQRAKKLDFRAVTPAEEVYFHYLQAVKEGGDSEVNRKKRHEILKAILEPLFGKKDAQRCFSPEQRRILWNSSDSRTCRHPGCNRELSWEDFHADHINPWSKGGKTILDNAAILCAEHNVKLGAKTKAALKGRTKK